VVDARLQTAQEGDIGPGREQAKDVGRGQRRKLRPSEPEDTEERGQMK
jgi:hypothetical protein